MSYLQNISRFNMDNLGGIIDIRVARKADVISIPVAINGSIYGPITMAEGKSFVQWSATIETVQAKSSSKTSREGTSRNNSVDFVVPRDRPEIKQMFDQASDGDEFIILYRYANSKWMLFGSLDNPLLFEYDHDSGSAFVDFNRYECRFYYEGPDNRFFYNAELPAPAAGPTPVIIRIKHSNDTGPGQLVGSFLPGETVTLITDFASSQFYTVSTS